MKFFRVKQISETEFIPQMRDWYEFTYNGIESIRGDYNIWFSPKYQKKYCCVSSLENAMGIIEDYKKSNGIKVKYPKYF
jgi:hypothetical protein